MDVPAARGVDVYVFAGPTMRLAIQRYNLFAGGGFVPPLWGLGVKYRCQTEMDQAGALRDMVQNHLLQVMANVAMEPSANFSSDAVRDERSRLRGGDDLSH